MASLPQQDHIFFLCSIPLFLMTYHYLISHDKSTIWTCLNQLGCASFIRILSPSFPHSHSLLSHSPSPFFIAFWIHSLRLASPCHEGHNFRILPGLIFHNQTKGGSSLQVQVWKIFGMISFLFSLKWGVTRCCFPLLFLVILRQILAQMLIFLL